MLSRRKWLALAAMGSLSTAAYPAYLEPRWLEVTHSEITSGWQLKRPVRILHLSDLHASVFVPLSMIEHAIHLGLAERPDLICVTGDFITDEDGFEPERYSELLRLLPRLVPTFAVLGNHDGRVGALTPEAFAKFNVVGYMLAQSGIKLLHNHSETVDVAGSRLNLVGVGDFWNREIDGTAAFSRVDATAPTVLLAHNPDSKNMLANFPWRIMLAGHTHGGQVLIPFAGPRYAPVRDKRFTAGLKPWRDRYLNVTRGVGNLGGVRFRCRPEVSILTLT